MFETSFDHLTALLSSAHLVQMFDSTIVLSGGPSTWGDVRCAGPDHSAKWFGLREDIDDDLFLRYQPSKTDNGTGAEITYSLKLAPMTVEELAYWPAEKRKGPVIVSEETELPYRLRISSQRWTVNRKTANLPSNL